MNQSMELMLNPFNKVVNIDLKGKHMAKCRHLYKVNY